jgi:hypothetical protein
LPAIADDNIAQTVNISYEIDETDSSKYSDRRGVPSQLSIMSKRYAQLKEYSIGRAKDRRQHLLQLTVLSPLMKEQLLKFRTTLVLGLLAAFGLMISSPTQLKTEDPESAFSV